MFSSLCISEAMVKQKYSCVWIRILNRTITIFGDFHSPVFFFLHLFHVYSYKGKFIAWTNATWTNV